ncbi:MAG: hypothetical protein E3K40_15930 [Candidatus Brocadia sp.]|nr:hypothetical protein [Candidatus Brocadia sp.]MDG6028155.1 hypothetical protein [Candidatus Brocadia sp.]
MKRICMVLGGVIHRDTGTCHCEGGNPKQSPRFGLLRCIRRNRFLFVFTLGMLMWTFVSLHAGDSVSYVPHGTVEERLREGIEYAQQGIDICIHNFAAIDVEKELVAARDRGVRVRIVILEYIPGKECGLLAEALIGQGFDIRVHRTSTSKNRVQDFILLDDRVLITGTYNWLAYRNRKIDNEVLFHYDQDRIRRDKNVFYRLFAEGEPVPFGENQGKVAAMKNPPAPAHFSDNQRGGQNILHQVFPGETGVSERPLETIVPAQTKDSLDISFEELDNQFGRQSTLSRAEKKSLWKKYKGKYVRWQGIVLYKGMGRVDWNRVGVSRRPGKKAEVEILFDWRLFEKVLNIRTGSTIIYSGKLVSRAGFDAPYRLEDGDIE